MTMVNLREVILPKFATYKVKKMAQEVYYSDYLQLDKILNAQEPESDKAGVEAHDEMLFIIIHQAYELWFKQILYEVGSVADIMMANTLNDNSPDLQKIVHRLERVSVILDLAVKQIDILDTMTPLDFLDFRDLLRPASGFQSVQFKVLEARLGLRMDERHGKKYYLSQLRPEHVKQIEDVEKLPSLLDLVNGWLERMPYMDAKYWDGFAGDTNDKDHPFWKRMRELYEQGLVEGEKQNIDLFNDQFFVDGREDQRLNAKANRSALFIMLYRDHPKFHLPFRLLDGLLEVDNQLATWRSKHINMVHRMIGKRVGTGGSTGKDYLKGAMNKHYVFKEIADLTTFLIDRRRLPELDEKLVTDLGY